MESDAPLAERPCDGVAKDVKNATNRMADHCQTMQAEEPQQADD